MCLSRFFIYALIDPNTSKVRYIGKSSTGFTRYTKHFLSHSLKLNTPKDIWIKELIKQKLVPGFQVIEFCEPENLCAREVFWIDHYRKKSSHWDLLNIATGGVGGNTGRSKHLRVPIYCINIKTGKRTDFEYIWQTANNGFCPSKVVAVCKKKRLSHAGHVFFYTNDPVIDNHELKHIYIPRSSKIISCIDNRTGKESVFPSIKEASLQLKISASTISHHLNGKSVCRTHQFFLMKREPKPVNKPTRIIL